MRSGKLKSIFHALIAMALTGVQPGSAALVTLTGSNVIYEYDSVINADALAMLGTPSIVGDAIRFLPPSLRAQSLNGRGPDSVTANFNFSSVRTIGAAEISSVRLLEFGDNEIGGGGNVSAELPVAISNNASPAESTQDVASFATSGATGGLRLWSLESTLNPADAFSSIASDISLSFGNTLTASTSELGHSAWIQKKLAFVASTTAPATPLSEPRSIATFAIGLLGMLAIGRRRVYAAR
ncbi:MAG: hypothetical protein HKN81_04700 [Gammaproteobacteria bacterium]|nr:hypothetical protein [Gammaproteobacteria bacterium]